MPRLLAFPLCLVFASLAAAPPRPEFPGKSPWILPHGSAWQRFPENTMPLFQHYWQAGFRILEMDVHLAADGQLVVIHDATVNDTTNGVGPVARRTLAELKKLDAGARFRGKGDFPFRGKGVTIPALREVLVAFPGAAYNIEIKTPDLRAAPALAKLLAEFRLQRQVLVASGHQKVLDRFRRLAPNVPTAGTPIETLLFLACHKLGLAPLCFIWLPCRTFQPSEKFLGRRVLTPGFIRSAHVAHCVVIPWTINRPEDLQRLLDWRVDGIITDYPERLREIFDRKKQGPEND
jgi:glycerophosphoryl diester phosphodiesterase